MTKAQEFVDIIVDADNDYYDGHAMDRFRNLWKYEIGVFTFDDGSTFDPAAPIYDYSGKHVRVIYPE